MHHAFNSKCGIICSIVDIANLKRHQRQDEILIIFTRTIQEISKVIYNKLMLYEMRA